MFYIKPVRDWIGFIIISGFLVGFWFLMSPDFSLSNILIGAGCAVGMTYFWREDLFRPGYPIRFNLRQVIKLAQYLVYLALNIVIANISVAIIVLSRKMPISPGFILLKTKLTRDLSRVLYANSITLTPGTVTIDLNGNRLLVHALTEDAAKGVYDWYMQDKMREIELIGR